MPQYLWQWTRNRYGNCPVMPAKGSPISSFLRSFLRHRNLRPEEEAFLQARNDGEIAQSYTFIVPSFPGRDPDYYNYLSPIAESQLRDLLRDLFDAELFADLSRFSTSRKQGVNIIYSWLDTHGIEPTEQNYMAVAKRYQLLRRREKDNQRKKKFH